MREIVDPDYDIDAVQEKVGGLPEGHSWQEVIDPSTGEPARVPLPEKPAVFLPADDDPCWGDGRSIRRIARFIPRFDPPNIHEGSDPQ